MKAIQARDYIRSAEDDEGNPLFGKEDIKVTEAQIKSFWGRLHAKVSLQTEDPTEEEIEAYKAGWDDAEAHGDRKEYY